MAEAAEKGGEKGDVGGFSRHYESYESLGVLISKAYLRPSRRGASAHEKYMVGLLCLV